MDVAIGNPVLFRGQEAEIRPAKVRRAVLTDGDILVPDRPEMVGARIKALMKLEAGAALKEASNHYARRLGREIGRVTLRDTRSRWGSCTSAGNLMFSWRLIMAPPDVLDYVAAHEVAHLIEMNHSPEYWRVVEQIYPVYQEQRQWLRRNGSLLHRFRFGD